MSFGSLKTLKLERTLGDATLSITKHVPTDASEVEEFDKLDESIMKSASNLRPFEPDEKEVTNCYPTIKDAEPKKPDNTSKPKSKGRGRPKGSTAKNTETKEEAKPETKNKSKKAETGKSAEVTEVKEEIADQNAKTELLQSFQSTFEDQIGFSSEEAYEKEFNEFLSSLISMDYKTFLEKELTVNQLKTFKDLI